MIAQLTMEQARFVSGGGDLRITTAGEAGVASAAIGGGVGASAIISSAGGVSGLATLGPAAIGVGSAAGAALGAAGLVGYSIGSYAYENSTTVQSVANSAVEAVIEAASAAGDTLKQIVGDIVEQVDDQ